MMGYNERLQARNDSLTVSTASVIVSSVRPENNQRKMILVRNISTNAADIISISLGENAAIANKGIVLNPNESFYDVSDNGYVAHQGMINAICATANGVLSITEV